MFKTLIVEDHTVFRQTLQLILNSRFSSLSIVEANTGKTALKQVKDFQPNLVFMDVHLPDDNGFSLTKTIKAEHADTTVIIITAYDLPEYRQAALDAGASHFIPKDSLNADAILELVEFIMACVSYRNANNHTSPNI